MSEHKKYHITSMQEMRQYFNNGSFAIPDLQREFVWNSRKATDLADSIYQQFPIGMILIWKTKSTKELRRLRGILPPFNSEKNKHCFYLLDGQQRVAVIYKFYNPDPEVQNERGQVINFDKICFKASESKFTYLNEEPNEKDYFSLARILNGHYTRSKRISENKKEKLREVKRRFDGLKLPFSFLRKPDEEYVKEAFIRLNSKGTPLRAADKVLARACDIKLRDKINNFKERLPNGFDNIENSTITDAIAFCLGLDDISENAKENFMKKLNSQVQEFDEKWKKIEKAIGKGISHLCRNFGVSHANILPSKTMIPVISVFFHHNVNKNPDTFQTEEIRKWFWASALTSRYTGRFYRKSIVQDIGRMEELAQSRRKLGLRFDKLEIDDLVRSDYSTNSTIVRAYFCLLASNEPRYLENGEKISLENPAVILDKKHKHHIFPKKALIKAGIKAKKYNSIINICYIPLQENVEIQTKLPFEYLRKYRDSSHFAKTMKSHLIPCGERSAIWKKDPKEAFDQFLAQRKEMVASSLEKEAMGKIFER